MSPDTDAGPVLRRAGDRDARAIQDLVKAAYEGLRPLLGRTPFPMLTDYARAVREHEVWVLEDRGSIVAIIELVPREDHLWVENVAVNPTSQGQGLGRRLLAFADDVARRRGYGEIGLLTNERYVANIAMYTRYGYRETHREPYLGTDLVYFRKPISG